MESFRKSVIEPMKQEGVLTGRQQRIRRHNTEATLEKPEKRKKRKKTNWQQLVLLSLTLTLGLDRILRVGIFKS